MINKIVDLEKYKRRIIDDVIDDYLKVSPAVCIEGCKWCGKSWTSSFHTKTEFLVGSPENNFLNRQIAEIDPMSVLEGEKPRLIDEWQEVPSLWDAVRMSCDKLGQAGQYILSGSSTPNTKGIMHSGTGRITKLRMRPMSLYESGDSSGVISLKDICNNKIHTEFSDDISLRQLASYVVRGGFPGNINSDEKLISIMPKSYVDSVLSDESGSIDNIKYDKKKMRLLLRSLARNETTLVSKSSLAKDIQDKDGEKISDETITTYLNVFDRMFLTDNLDAFSVNYRSSLRVRQLEKRHLCDPSIVCAILGLSTDKLMTDLQTFGFLFEALVERDLRIYADSFNAKVFHYRDYNDNEIDAVIELEDGQWCGFEIKLGYNQVESAAQGLIRIKKIITDNGGREPSALCVICGMSNTAYRRSDGVMVVPVTMLKN